MKYKKITLFSAVFSLVCLAEFAVADNANKESISLFKQNYASYTSCKEDSEAVCSCEAEAAYEAGQKVFKEDSKNLALLLANYGHEKMLEKCKKNPEKALVLLKQAKELTERAFGKQSQEKLSVLKDMSFAAMDLDVSGREKVHYGNRAVSLSKDINGENSLAHALVMSEVGMHHLLATGLGRAKVNSEKYLLAAQEILDRELGVDHIMTGNNAFNLGKFYRAADEKEKALVYFNQALTAFDITQGRNKMALTVRGFLVALYEELDKSELATAHLQAIGAASPSVATEEFFPVYKRAPEYPESAANRGDEGAVVVEYTVDKDGRVKDPKVVYREGSEEFIEPSVEAAKKFRYAPMYIDGKPVDTERVRNRFTYEMR